MKKYFVLILALALMSSLVLAAGGDGLGANGEQPATGPEETGNIGAGQDTGAGAGVQTEESVQNQGAEQQIQTQNQVQTAEQMSANAQQVQARVQEKLQTREQELGQEMAGKSEKEQNVLKNQNRVRLAVHALLEMKDDIGGIGPQVSEIAKHFNNSVQNTIKAEEKVQTRSALSRFFAGGDKKAAEEIEADVKANQEKIQELKQLKEQCECGEEVKALMQEQIQSMEQEQNRLGELAQKEKKSKGLFGWIWK
jgi:hypothetical protein